MKEQLIINELHTSHNKFYVQLIINELQQKPIRFFSVLDMQNLLTLKNLIISKEEIKDILEYFFNKEMLCRVRSKKLDNPYLYLYGSRIIYTDKVNWKFMYDISEFVLYTNADISKDISNITDNIEKKIDII